MTPAQDRLAYRQDAKSCPALAALRAWLSDGKKETEDTFRAWRAQPVTRKFLAALSELAGSPPIQANEPTDTNRVLVQYGMTAGLELAHRLLSQPGRVYPEIFASNAGQADGGELDRGYEDYPDDV